MKIVWHDGSNMFKYTLWFFDIKPKHRPFWVETIGNSSSNPLYILPIHGREHKRGLYDSRKCGRGPMMVYIMIQSTPWEIENHLRCYICYCSIFWGGCFCFWLHVKWVFVDGNGELACISNHINNKADRSGALWLQPPDLSHFTPAFSAAAGPSGNRFKLWRLKNIRHDRTDHNC